LTDFNYLVNNYADGDLDGFKPPPLSSPFHGKARYSIV